MRHKVFSVHDAKAAAFLPPFMFPTEGMAVRAVVDLVKDPAHNFSRHAADFTLFQLAEFDDESGQYIPLEGPKVIGTCLQLKALSDQVAEG